MPSPKEQAVEGPGAAGRGAAEPSAISAGRERPGEPLPNGPDVVTPGHEQARPNGAATTSLVAGILGFTGVGVIAGIAFGMLGLARSRRRRSGKVRSWMGIVAALLWAAGLTYVVPHVIKAADPGCADYKARALPQYNRAIDDLGARAATSKVTADLKSAIAYLGAAASKSRNAESRTALEKLTAQLRTVLADEASDQVPGSVMPALNNDAAAADSACGTF